MTANDIRALILSRIAAGMYKPGDPLPSVRALGVELGANRNTASKAYQELKRDGFVRSSQGWRTIVVEVPDRMLPLAEERVGTLLRSAFSYATQAGVPKLELRTLIDHHLRQLGRPTIRIAFIECNEDEADEIAERMQRVLGYPVDPFVLDALPRGRRHFQSYPIITTTLYHLSEVQAKLADRSIRVIGLQHSPSTESILEIARLKRGTRLAVVATNTRTLTVLLKLVETYHTTVVGSCLTEDAKEVRRLAGQADVLIAHSWARRSVRSRRARRIITVSFQIEPQSLAYVRQRIARLGTVRDRQTASAM
ncbi:MAG: hypothetical protein A2W26_07695 [Acidobacteria bacterium RBG_16_64_8]|nr:MAG: hypothetical protein A2W26_07695 [Acidobacteria bacterium RBG_16_64_8]